ncbi:MAG: hypothetical protein Q6373_019770 [Candidatus Sigynarchaeota archaeon]
MNETHRARRDFLRRSGAIFYLVFGMLLALVTTAILFLWDEDELVEYWYYFVIGAVVLYGLAATCIATGIINHRRKEMPRGKAIALFLTGIVLIAGSAAGIGWYAWDRLVPKPYKLYPRQFAIQYDPSFTFSTQYGDLNQTLETLYASIWPSGNPTTPDGYAWGESYVCRGFVHMYNATRDEKYLWPLLNRTDSIYANRDRNGDGVPGYGTDTYTDGVYVEYIVWDGIVLMPLAQIANIIKRDVTLWANLSLQAKALDYISVCEQVIQKWNKTHWHEPGDGSGYYVSPPQNTTAIFNRIAAFGLMTLQSYDFTGNATYLAMATKMARFFQKYLTLRTYTMDGETREMYTWGYDWNGNNEDTSHGCIEVEFAVDCHERGIVFTATDMRRLSHTFIDFVYRGRPSQTAQLELDNNLKPPGYVNHTNTFSDMINGETGDGNYYLVLRQAWFQLYRYHENVTLASHVVARSLSDLVRAMPTRPPYHTSLSTTYMQGLAAIRHMVYVAREPLAAWF